jgi:hypothetical protein
MTRCVVLKDVCYFVYGMTPGGKMYLNGGYEHLCPIERKVGF